MNQIEKRALYDSRSLLTPLLKQSLSSGKEYIHTFNYHEGLICFKMRLVLPEKPWLAPTWGWGSVEVGAGQLN